MIKSVLSGMFWGGLLSGLGLAVVKAVARAHQGQLLLQSRAGRGTCAIVSLPLLNAAPHSKQE